MIVHGKFEVKENDAVKNASLLPVCLSERL
jgi:hypothetical protein